MKAMLKRVLCAAIALSIFGGEAWAQMVQVQLTKDMRLKRRGVLVSETVIPAGTIVEVSVDNYNQPVRLRSWRGGGEAQDEFVQGIRVVQAPGFAPDDVQELNEALGGRRGLFMRKSVIGDAVVVSVRDRRMQLATRGDAEVYRRHVPDLQENALQRPVTTDVIKDVVDQIEAANKATKEMTEGASCRRFQDKWVRAGVPKRALEEALRVYEKNPKGVIKNKRFITIADFSKHSGQKRLFVLDTKTGKVERFHTSHGNGRGSVSQGRVSKFSNRHNSHLTPSGFHVTGKKSFYHRRLKRSIQMHGIESRNSNSARRGILIHQADYASESFVRRYGYTGRSHGCLTIDPSQARRMFNLIEGGSLVYNYTGQ